LPVIAVMSLRWGYVRYVAIAVWSAFKSKPRVAMCWAPVLTRHPVAAHALSFAVTSALGLVALACLATRGAGIADTARSLMDGRDMPEPEEAK